MGNNFKAFANFETLTADELNLYLMRQAVIHVDNQAGRDAIPSPGQGMLVYRGDLGCYQWKHPTRGWLTLNGFAYTKRTRSTDLAIATETWTAVPFNVEARSVSNVGAIAVSSAVHTVPMQGIYSISASCMFTINATGRRCIRVMVNGVEAFRSADMTPRSDVGGVAQVRGDEFLTVGDTITVEALQTSGIWLNVLGDIRSSYLMISGRPA